MLVDVGIDDRFVSVYLLCLTMALKIPYNVLSSVPYTAEAKMAIFGSPTTRPAVRVAGTLGEQVLIANIYRIKAPSISKLRRGSLRKRHGSAKKPGTSCPCGNFPASTGQ